MNMRGKVKGVCISPTKGTAKQPVGKGIFIKEFGIENDAHAGEWHRQVSLLSYDSVIAFNEKGGDVSYGDFGENLLVEGIDLKRLPVGTILKALPVTATVRVAFRRSWKCLPTVTHCSWRRSEKARH